MTIAETNALIQFSLDYMSERIETLGHQEFIKQQLGISDREFVNVKEVIEPKYALWFTCE